MDIIPATPSKSLTKYTNYATYLLNVNDYYKIPILSGMESITTEEVVEN